MCTDFGWGRTAAAVLRSYQAGPDTSPGRMIHRAPNPGAPLSSVRECPMDFRFSKNKKLGANKPSPWVLGHEPLAPRRRLDLRRPQWTPTSALVAPAPAAGRRWGSPPAPVRWGSPRWLANQLASPRFRGRRMEDFSFDSAFKAVDDAPACWRRARSRTSSLADTGGTPHLAPGDLGRESGTTWWGLPGAGGAGADRVILRAPPPMASSPPGREESIPLQLAVGRDRHRRLFALGGGEEGREGKLWKRKVTPGGAGCRMCQYRPSPAGGNTAPRPC